ncbi:MAG: transmembrane anchor protein [candidate division Zixibacteria bacterium]|nr:transmembrane anchor protein [candidate division Zixibacteria bacterium]
MRNQNIPSDVELPSIGRLIKSTILAICIAAIILVTVVLPAEYGIDPTGVGGFLGLAKMGEIKVSLAAEAASDSGANKAAESAATDLQKVETQPLPPEASGVADRDVRSDEITISLTPNEGKEIKLAMNKGQTVEFAWWTDGGKANFDAHADSEALQIKYHNYTKGSTERDEGVLEAAFDGKHGWFWRNRTSEPLTVTLKVSGDYSSIDRMN